MMKLGESGDIATGWGDMLAGGSRSIEKTTLLPGGDNRLLGRPPVYVGYYQSNATWTSKTYSTARGGVAKRVATDLMDETATRARLDIDLAAVDGDDRLGLTLVHDFGAT